MKSQLEIDSDNPGKLGKILEPSLRSRGKVELGLETEDDSVNVEVVADGLGPLRGTTDNVFRLASLAKKIYED